MGPQVTAGFFLEKTFARMCRESLAELGPTPHLGKSHDSIASASVSPEQTPRQYRGLQRDPLQGWEEALHGSGVIEPPDEELAAGLFLTELEDEGKADWGIVFTLEDAQEVIRRIAPPAHEHAKRNTAIQDSNERSDSTMTFLRLATPSPDSWDLSQCADRPHELHGFRARTPAMRSRSCLL